MTSHKKLNPSARIGVPVSQSGVKLLGLAGVCYRAAGDFSQQAKPVSQDWGRVVEACRGLLGQLATSNKKPNPSARIGVKLLGLAGVC